jgi:hypothetical protein
MFYQFTDRARKVMALANQEAQRFNHEYIGTEHILLGLVKEGSGVGATVLKNHNVDIKKLRLEVKKLVKSNQDMVTMGRLPRTPRAKKVIEYAIEEAQSHNHTYVGTEHILLGLFRENKSTAAQVLMNLDLSIEQVRHEVLLFHGVKKDDVINDYHATDQKPKSESQKSRASIAHSIPEDRMTWVKCLNDRCQAEYQIGLRGYVKYVEANFDAMSPHAPTLICEKCGEQSILIAQKCTNSTCGKVFIRNAYPKDFTDRCTVCGFSDIEERRKHGPGSRS